MKRFLGGLAIVVLLGAGIAAWYWHALPTERQSPPGNAKKGRSDAAGGPVPVAVSLVTSETVPVYRTGIGNVVALYNATIRAQVDGRLVSVDFVEGQDVKKGGALARIDPTLYQAAYDQAVAKKAQDEAMLANARIDLDRYQRLARDNAGTKQQADQQAALVRQLEAQVQADAAASESAKATLSYTTILAPFDGRVGLRLVDPGNIVHITDSGGIATLAQVQPIAIVFSLPQRDLDAVNSAMARGPVAVEAIKAGGGDVVARGKLIAIDNQIDLTTGTFRLKAEFDNTDLKLWPGQFVNTRAIVNVLKDAMTVPAAAVRRGSLGTFVYTVDDDRRAHVRPVEVAIQDDVRAVITKGVSVGARVVTVGFNQLTDGARVVVLDERQKPSAATDAGTPKQGRSDKLQKQTGRRAQEN
jgi:multidrug efflux system membrane fusion protein